MTQEEIQKKVARIQSLLKQKESIEAEIAEMLSPEEKVKIITPVGFSVNNEVFKVIQETFREMSPRVQRTAEETIINFASKFMRLHQTCSQECKPAEDPLCLLRRLSGSVHGSCLSLQELRDCPVSWPHICGRREFSAKEPD